MIKRIQDIFKERKPGLLGEYKRNSVAILLYEENEEIYLVFEVRSQNLKHQPGDICLPGGRIEPNETPRDCALRETMEELNINEDDVEYIGPMDTFISPYSSMIYSFIFRTKTKSFKPNPNEVDHVFMVPLSFFLNSEPKSYSFGLSPTIPEDFPYELISGGKSYKFNKGKQYQYFYSYDRYVIWGFTALIVKSFIDILKETAKI